MSGSKRGNSTSRAPIDIANVRQSVRPYAWNIGSTAYTTHPSPRTIDGTHARACAAFESRLRCVSEAPLGVPVVPLVYWMSARSSVAGFGWDAGSGVVPTTYSHDTVPRDPLVQRRARLARLRDRQAEREAGAERHRLGDVDRDQRRDGEVGGELLHRSSRPSSRRSRAWRRGPRTACAARAACRAGCARRRPRRGAGSRRTRRCAAGSSAARSRRDRPAPRPDRAAPRRRASICSFSSRYDVVRPKNCRAGGIRVVARGRLDDVDERSGDGLEVLRHPLGVAAGPRARRIVRRHAPSLRLGAAARRGGHEATSAPP